MTQLLKKAFDKASKLPDEAQDDFARLMLAELESDQRWETLLSSQSSEQFLDRMSDEVLSAHRAGDTKPLDPDRM